MFLDKTSTKNRQHEDGVDDNEKERVDGQGEVKFLRDLVLELQSEKKELHKLLDQQQRLALQDKKLLDEYKSEIKNLKSVTAPPRNETPPVSENHVVEDRVNQPKNRKKRWWRFYKT